MILPLVDHIRFFEDVVHFGVSLDVSESKTASRPNSNSWA